jgi:hypothetical protein
LAQQASENIIKSLTTAAYIKRFRNVPNDKFVAEIKNWGEGLYIVGLDFHVGFIIYTDNEVYFVHSSFETPAVVVKEKADESSILSNSKYRVAGKISDDDTLLIKWLEGRNFPTVKR